MWPFKTNKKNVGEAARIERGAESAGRSQAKTTAAATRTNITTIGQAYEFDPFVARCIDEIIQTAASVKFDVKVPDNARLRGIANAGNLELDLIDLLINDRPNSEESRYQVFRNLYFDIITTGQGFLVQDRNSDYLYNLLSDLVRVNAGEDRRVRDYEYNGQITYSPREIIRITSARRAGNRMQTINGTPSANAALRAIAQKMEALGFQDSVFRNDSILNYVIETDAILSKRHKTRLEEEFTLDVNRRTGRKTTKILDGGATFREVRANLVDTNVVEIVSQCDQAICTALGVPYSIMSPTNSANTTQDRLSFYHSTINNLCRQVASALELHFGVDIELDFSDIPMVEMERLHMQANNVSTLVNNGISTPNEGRDKLRFDPLTADQMEGDFDPDKVRVPQNIAGSAAQPNLGGQGNENS